MFPIPSVISAIEDQSDREFMEQLFLSYQRLIYHTIIQIVHDAWVTEDLLQSTIVSLIDNLETIRRLPERKLVNYIVSTAKNKAISQLRQNNRNHEFHFEDTPNLPDPTEDNIPELFVLRQETFGALATVWEQLDERSQYLLRGRYILGKSYDELSRELGIQPQSVRMAVTRAKRIARSYFKSKS